jgi:hypothetical protein
MMLYNNKSATTEQGLQKEAARVYILIIWMYHNRNVFQVYLQLSQKFKIFPTLLNIQEIPLSFTLDTTNVREA